MKKQFKQVMAIAVVAALYGCAAPDQRSAAPESEAATHEAAFPWAAKPMGTSAPVPAADKSRLPQAGDTGVAWDEVAHRGEKRWLCRATPSGAIVMDSLCNGRPRVDTRWPGLTPPANWDGVVHAD